MWVAGGPTAAGTTRSLGLIKCYNGTNTIIRVGLPTAAKQMPPIKPSSIVFDGAWKLSHFRSCILMAFTLGHNSLESLAYAPS